MSRDVIVDKITKLMDSVPESILQEILSYLSEVNQVNDGKNKDRFDKLKQILEEDKNLLKRLAE